METPTVPAATDRQAPPSEGRPLRFMQIHSFYEQYLAELYGQHPNLAQASHAAQMQVLREDGFSAVHMLGFHLESLGYESRVVIGNNLPAQYAWAFENGLARGPRRAPSLQEILLAQIEAFRPDVLYLSHPTTYDSNFVRQLPRRPRLVLGWRAANVPPDWDVSEFDVMLSCLAGIRRVARERGAKDAIHFYPGFPQFLFEAVRRASPSHDVCFYGQVNGSQYPSRIRMLNTLTESCLRDGHHLRMHLSGNLATATPITRAVNLGPAYGLNLYRLIRTSRITFDVRGTIETSDGAGAVQDLAGRETANMRLFEATGLGTCLMTEHYDNLTELFEPGKEIVTYSSERDLTEKLRHYLAHEDERQAIAAAGLARCQRDHSMAARAREFDAIIRDKLARRDGVPPVAATRTAAPPPNIERVVASLERLAAKGALQETAVAPVLRQAMEIIASLLSCGDLDRALRLATAARSLKIAMPGLHLARARVFLALGQPDQAREALAEELRDFPRSADGLELLAQMDSASQRHD